MGLTSQRQDHRSLEDGELLEAARTDLEAFGELVRRHQDFVYGAAMRVVRNPVLAEDLTQEAFVRAYRALPDFRGDAHVRSWLYRIVGNLAINAVQRRREFPTEHLPESVTPSGPERRAEAVLMSDHLEAAITALPEDQRVPLVLREFEGWSYQEIADHLDVPLNTVRTRILRGRRALRSKMEEWR